MNDKIQMDDPRHPLHGLQPADSTIFVIADERFGETSIYAEKELERVILECAEIWPDDWNDKLEQHFRDAADYYDLSDDEDRAEYEEHYGMEPQSQITESAQTIINVYCGIDMVMTPAEIERKYNLGAGTVRQYLSRNGKYMLRNRTARQPDKRTWLILRREAHNIWGK